MKLKKLFDKLATIGCEGGSRRDGFIESVECGQFTLDFYYDEENIENCKVEIRCGVQMEVTLKAMHESYGFLMSCYNDGAKDAMEAYCGMLWQCSYLLAMDRYFPKRVGQSWQKYFRELEKRAKAAASEVSEEQNEADEALMSEAVRISELPDEEKAKLADDVTERLNAVFGESKPKKRRKK